MVVYMNVKNSKIINSLNENLFLKLLGLKILTYPIVGLSTLYALKIVRAKFEIGEFNLFMLIWSSIGLIGIIEYGLGVNLTNHILVEGFNVSFRKKIVKISSYIFIPLIISVLFGLYLRFSSYDQNQPENLSIKGQRLSEILIFCSIAVIFIAFYNIVTRISNGISNFSSPQTTLALGNVVSIIILAILSRSHLGILAYVVALASSYFFSAFFQISRKSFWSSLVTYAPAQNQLALQENFMGWSYTTTIVMISLLSSFINFFPRWNFSSISQAFEVSYYLAATFVVGVLTSISSILGPFLWNIGVRRKVSGQRNFPLQQYRVTIQTNFILLIPFFAFYILFAYFFELHMSRSTLLSLGGIAYLNLALQNIHLIASNFLNGHTELVIQMILLVFQALSIIFAITQFHLHSAVELYSVQTLVFLFLGVLPSIFVLWNKSHDPK
jgi:hypothetical protein